MPVAGFDPVENYAIRKAFSVDPWLLFARSHCPQSCIQHSSAVFVARNAIRSVEQRKRTCAPNSILPHKYGEHYLYRSRVRDIREKKKARQKPNLDISGIFLFGDVSRPDTFYFYFSGPTRFFALQARAWTAVAEEVRCLQVPECRVPGTRESADTRMS